MIHSVRTKEDRFMNLPDYPFQPHYVQDLPSYKDLRVHYLDEGNNNTSHDCRQSFEQRNTALFSS